MRADDPQLRPVHLLRDPFPHLRSSVDDAVAVIGIGNEFRRDDGIGPTIARAVAERTRPPVRVVVCDGDPTVLLEAWAGAELAVVVDAVTGAVPCPGVVHRIVGDDLATAGTGAVSTHGLGLADAYRLGAALHRLPQRWVLYGVEVADVGVGYGMSPSIERAAATVVSAVLSEIAAAS